MNARFFFLAAVIVGGAGCGSPDICARGSSCSNDPMPTMSEITQCKATLDANKNATCANLVVQYLNCTFDNRVCGAGMVTDGSLSATKAENNCKQQFDAADGCCRANPTSTACK